MAEDDARRLISACLSSLSDAAAILANEPELIRARDGLGETALHYLAVENRLDAVKMLIVRGAEVNTLNECGGTPLSEAASLGYFDMVSFLLAHGAKLDLPGQSEPTLHEAVRGGNVSIVAMLLHAGAAIDATNDLRETALHLAVEEDARFDVAQPLLEAGANVTHGGFSMRLRWTSPYGATPSESRKN